MGLPHHLGLVYVLSRVHSQHAAVAVSQALCVLRLIFKRSTCLNAHPSPCSVFSDSNFLRNRGVFIFDKAQFHSDDLRSGIVFKSSSPVMWFPSAVSRQRYLGSSVLLRCIMSLMIPISVPSVQSVRIQMVYYDR